MTGSLTANSSTTDSMNDIISDIHYLFDEPQSSVIDIESDNESIHSNDYPEDSAPNEDKCPKIFHLTADEVLRLAGNALCDGPWASVSALGINVRGRNADGFLPATGAQVTYAIPVPFVLFIAATCLSQKISPQKAVASFIALAAGMLAWNLGQYYGEQYFGKLGMSAKNAGYTASLYTGPAEGAVQAFLYDAILAALGDKETKENYRKFNESVPRAALFFFSYFLTSSFSGMAWQVIYNAIFPNCTNTPTDCTDSSIKNVVLVGFAVALGAALVSYLSGVAFKASAQCLFPRSSSAVTQRDDLAEPFLDVSDASASAVSLRTT